MKSNYGRIPSLPIEFNGINDHVSQWCFWETHPRSVWFNAVQLRWQEMLLSPWFCREVRHRGDSRISRVLEGFGKSHVPQHKWDFPLLLQIDAGVVLSGRLRFRASLLIILPLPGGLTCTTLSLTWLKKPWLYCCCFPLFIFYTKLCLKIWKLQLNHQYYTKSIFNSHFLVWLMTK